MLILLENFHKKDQVLQKMKKFIYIFIFILIFFLIPKFSQAFSDIPYINALCAVAIDGNTGKILFAKNPHLKIPPASTEKLVTAMVVLDHLPLSEEVKISEKVSKIPSVPPKLYKGEVYTVKDLLYLMLMKSSNQAAVALAEAVAGSEKKFASLMNQKVHSLGLKNSHFVTASGLPAPNQYTTPYELAIIFYEALKYPLIKKIISTPVKIITSETGRTLVIKNTNKLLRDPQLKDTIIGGKTGFTRASKHCLVNGVYIGNKLIITSVLGSPKRSTLWKDSKTLIKFAKAVIKHQTSPVYITTVVNTNVLVNKQFRKYYWRRHKRYRRYKRRYRRKRRRFRRLSIKSQKYSMNKSKTRNNTKS